MDRLQIVIENAGVVLIVTTVAALTVWFINLNLVH